MRLLCLLILTAATLTACSRASYGPEPSDPLGLPDQARADSLAALPPDSLSTADVAWLQRHAAEEERERERAEEVRSQWRASMQTIGVILLIAAGIGVYAVIDAQGSE